MLQDLFVYLGTQSNGDIERDENDPSLIVSKPYFDSNNEGFIHTPSPAHAITAAILRSGYLSNNPTKEHDEFAINLSSARVRKALYYIDGMKNSQELANNLFFSLCVAQIHLKNALLFFGNPKNKFQF